MTRTTIALTAVFAVVVVGVLLWITVDRAGPAEQGRESLGTPPRFDTTGGQEMRPRWGQQQGASHDAPQN